jgi:hypothetical protein
MSSGICNCQLNDHHNDQNKYHDDTDDYISSTREHWLCESVWYSIHSQWI